MPDPILRAWLALLALSVASVVVAWLVGVGGFGEAATGAVIFILAWSKARIILSRYLGLWQAPTWLSGFNWVLGLYCLLMLGLFLIPAF